MIPVSISAPTPREPRFGLLSLPGVIIPGDAQDRWLQGAQLERFICSAVPQLYEQCDTNQVMAYLDAPAPTSFGTFAVVLGGHCTARSVGDERTWEDRLRATFRAVESAGAERELWASDSTLLNPSLSDTGTPVITGLLSPTVALQELELAIAASAAQGVIHARPSVITAWQRYNLLVQEGNGATAYLRTVNGTPVVSGRGYTGVGPTGAANAAVTGTTEWAYASGQIEVRRNPNEFVAGGETAMKRRTNDVYFSVGREYLVTWDACVHSAVRIDRAL